MRQYLIYMLVGAIGGICGSYSMQTYLDHCAKLVAIEQARDAKVQAIEQKQKEFFTGPPAPVPADIPDPRIY